ncbi:ribonuclease H-like domain-containing protein [Obelidium mucronatum]|nr:ribonuclease H-like domain-containing protein [Obelidium mucronatum]
MSDTTSAPVLAGLAAAVAQSAGLATKELFYHVAADKAAAAAVGGSAATLLALLNHALRCASPSAPSLASADDVADRFDGVVEGVDRLLEQADSWIDRVKASKKGKALPLAGAPATLSASTPTATTTTKQSTTSRPQLAFTDTIDNSNSGLFIPKLTEKHFASKPLDSNSKSHPYQFEIDSIVYPQHVWNLRPEIMYSSLEETPFTFVETEAAFLDLLSVLETVEEIAVDLEHHDYRSFQGFTCLIQISTRKQDYIIDALLLRSHLPLLNKVFANPNILKLFHGAESDIVWLQRDFGVYVVGMFDTYHASHVLELEAHGLAFLLKYYCGVDTNKKYQMADWRVRPIPKEMIKYARIDTHYLLYIYDRMRNEVLEKDLDSKQPLRVVLERSARTTLNLYQKEVYDAETGEGPNGWANHLRKINIPMTPIQLAVYKAIHAWRDHIARLEDESVRYVTPTNMLTNIAVELPSTLKALQGCCHPMMPNLMKVYAQDVLLLIEQTRLSESTSSTSQNSATTTTTTTPSAKPTRTSTKTALKSVTLDPPLLTSQKPTAVITFNPNKIKTNIIVSWKTTESLGSMLMPRGGAECTALAEAEAIRASLYLVPPSFAKKRSAEDDDGDGLEGMPKLKKPLFSTAAPAPKEKKVTMESVVPVGKAQVKAGVAPASVSEALKSSLLFDEAARREKAGLKKEGDGSTKTVIPALEGEAYVYPTVQEDVMSLGGDDGFRGKGKGGRGGKSGRGGAAAVFNPYGVVTQDVQNVGTAKGPKQSKGKSTTFRK